MIKILSLKTEITKEQRFKHIEFPFVLNEDYSKLEINYHYSPKDYLGDDGYEMALNAFKEAYGDVRVEADEVISELPLKNHVTLSLTKDTRLVGTAHRHANDIKIIVGKDGSTEGFYSLDVNSGNYAIVLSVHAILSDIVNAEIEVVAYE